VGHFVVLQDEETALLEQALAMSMADDAEAGASGGRDIPMGDAMSEELALGTCYLLCVEFCRCFSRGKTYYTLRMSSVVY
jgi:hypothetical protein